MTFSCRIDDDLALRLPGEADAEELFALVDRNRAHLREWLPWVDANVGVEQSRQFIRSVQDQEARGLGFACVAVWRGSLAGTVGFHPIRWADRSVKLGYWLSRDLVGRGIVTRSCRVLVDHAFAVLGVDRIEILVATENVRSRAISERLGFVQEAVVAGAERLADRVVDHVVYAMRRTDWPRAVPPGGSVPSRES